MPDVAAESAAVRDLLGRSVAATGVDGSITAGPSACAPAGSSHATGTQAVAWTVIPVFTRYDDAQEPFEAVTSLWTQEGLRQTDRALGLDIWSTTNPRSLVAGATIRGTTDGLSLRVESRCVSP